MQSFPFHPRRGPSTPVLRINFKGHYPPPERPRYKFAANIPEPVSPRTPEREEWDVPMPKTEQDLSGIIALLALTYMTLALAVVAEFWLVYVFCVLVLVVLGWRAFGGRA